jgi:hypothetical protein
MTRSIILSISRSLLVSIIFIGIFYNTILGDKKVEFHQLKIDIYPNPLAIVLSDTSTLIFKMDSSNLEKLIKQIKILINDLHKDNLGKCKLQKKDGRVPYSVERDSITNNVTLTLSSPSILDLENCKDVVINKIELIFEDERNQVLESFAQQKAYKYEYELTQKSFSIFSNLQQLIILGQSEENEVKELYEKFREQTIVYQNKLYDLSEQKIKDFNFLQSIDYRFSKIQETKFSRSQSLVVLVFFSIFILLTLLDIKFIQKLSLKRIIDKFFN